MFHRSVTASREEDRPNRPKRPRLAVAWRAVAVGTAGALLLAACSSSSSKSATTAGSKKTPVTFHVVLSETGAASFLGSREAKGMQQLTSEVNSHGGIDGHPMALDMVDNQSSPTVAVSLATPWIREGVPFIIDGSLGATDDPIDALAGSTGPVIYDSSPVAEPANGSYVYAAGNPNLYQARAMVSYLRLRGLTRVAVISSSSASGQNGWSNLQAALALPANKGFTLTTHQTFDPTDVTVTTELSAIKATNPQAILIWATSSIGTVLKGMSELAMDTIPTVTEEGDAVNSNLQKFSSVLPANFYLAVASFYLPTADVPASIRPVVATFDKLVASDGGHPNDGWALTYSAALVIIAALEHLGVNATAPEIHKYIDGLTAFPDIFGIYNFKKYPQRGVGGSDTYVARWTGSTFQPVTDAGATALAAS